MDKLARENLVVKVVVAAHAIYTVHGMHFFTLLRGLWIKIPTEAPAQESDNVMPDIEDSTSLKSFDVGTIRNIHRQHGETLIEQTLP